MRLADAKKQALELNTWIKDGIDPRTQAPGQRRKQVENSCRPFAQIAQVWFDHHSPSWSSRSCRDMREKLDHFENSYLVSWISRRSPAATLKPRLLTPILARGAHEQARR